MSCCYQVKTSVFCFHHHKIDKQPIHHVDSLHVSKKVNLYKPCIASNLLAHHGIPKSPKSAAFKSAISLATILACWEEGFVLTLPETKSLPLKNGDWKSFLFVWFRPIFRGRTDTQQLELLPLCRMVINRTGCTGVDISLPAFPCRWGMSIWIPLES